jgi:hypothetical protein
MAKIIAVQGQHIFNVDPPLFVRHAHTVLARDEIDRSVRFEI